MTRTVGPSDLAETPLPTPHPPNLPGWLFPLPSQLLQSLHLRLQNQHTPDLLISWSLGREGDVTAHTVF